MLKILKNQTQIDKARNELTRLDCDYSRGLKRKVYVGLYALRFRALPPPIAVNKSWDVLEMRNLIASQIPDPHCAILDMGSYNSEIPLSLWSSGYRNIIAMDLNPIGRTVTWYGNLIKFRQENFYKTQIPKGTLDVITALSVIEHGYHEATFLETASGLLKPGGILCITTDYREPKIHVAPDFKLFGLSYMIFSRQDIESLIQRAKACGLEPVGELEWGESDYPISFEGFQFTFLFLAFRKI